MSLQAEIAACDVCAASLPHGVRPVVSFSSTARLLIIGQAPGSKVHASGVPWDDQSGDRLREWTGLTKDQMYDPSKVALVPMAFCYPGKASGGDKPPRPECAPKWHDQVLGTLPTERLTLLVGAYAQAYHLPETRRESMADRVARYRDFLPSTIPLPHPAWRSTLFMKKHAWFESDLLPELRARIAHAMR